MFKSIYCSKLNMTILDPVTGYCLPTLVYHNNEKVCGCDMCFSQLLGPVNNIGPHDLHCMCDPCCSFACDQGQYFRALDLRYPEWSKILPFSIEDYDLNARLERACDPKPYEVTWTSPTNSEMHSYIGNGDSTWNDFMHAAARGALGSPNEPDRFAAGAMAAIGFLGSSMLYTAHSNMAKPLAELRDQLFHHGPSNSDMHSYNGNIEPLPPPVVKSDVSKRLHKKVPKPKPIDHFDPDYDDIPRVVPVKRPVDHFDPDYDDIPTVNGDVTRTIPITDYLTKVTDKVPQLKSDPTMAQLINQVMQPKPNVDIINQLATQIKETYPEIRNIGPTNKEMHALNGNIMGPANKGVGKKKHKRQLRKLARKINHQKKLTRFVFKKQYKKTIAKGKIPKKVRNAAKEVSQEKRLAMRYASFLRNPVWKPPQLGSTGDVPTKMLHGYYEATISMSNTGAGFGSIANATDMIAFLSPKMVSFAVSQNNFSSPVSVGFCINSTTAFNNTASTSVINCLDFLNVTPLKNESGATSTSGPVPPARFVGGHVSLKCRCPMSTTAPPYVFGGLLPSQNLLNSGTFTVDPSLQLNQLSTTQIRALKSTTEEEGFEISAVYLPGSAKSLDFSTNVASYVGVALDNTPIPYVGMTGCPTTASVTVIVSAWFEVQQNTQNMSYSGWSRGPKVATEDIFDHLPNIRPVQPIALNLGSKDNASTGSSVFEMLRPKPKPVEEELAELKAHLDVVNTRFKQLQVDTNLDESEDEKYFDSPSHTSASEIIHDASGYRNLSRSTIDLALQLKDKLTPGSVTSKTSRVQAA